MIPACPIKYYENAKDDGEATTHSGGYLIYVTTLHAGGLRC